jgi:hypothetical protein
MGRCTSRSILRAPLGQSCLELTIGTGWRADMRTAQARLMDSSLSRQAHLSLSIFPDRLLHRLTESVRREISVVVTSMLLESPTDSWLAPQAHPREIRRARWSLQSTHRRRSRHLTRRPRRGELQCRRAELSIVGGPRRRGFVTTRAWMNRRFQLHKRRQLFIRGHDEKFSVRSRINNENVSPL